jgi:integrase
MDKRRRGKTPGLYRDGKTGAWKIDKVWKGTRIRGSVGANFGEAEGELLDRINELIAGQKAPRARCTFEEAALHYLELHPTKLSIEEERAWLVEMMPHIGKLPLDRIYDKTLQPFVDEQRKKRIRRRGGWQVGLKAKTINLKLGLVRHILILASRSWRDDDGEPWLPAAPLITMLQGGDEREPRQLTWQEQREHLAKLPRHLYAMALFALQTGVREEVICGLQWEWEVYLEEVDIATFIVPVDFVKGQKGKKTARVVVCNTTARAVIDAQRGVHPTHVFAYAHNVNRAELAGELRRDYEGKPPHPIQTINNTAWQKWRERCGLDDLHVHDLRHTVGMRLREAGVPENTIADVLWHRRKSMTNHYSVAQVMEIYGAVEKLTTESNAFNKSLATIARETRRKSA